MKLTNAHRAETIERCMKAKFSKREAAYLKQRAALADALYDLAYGAVEKIVKKLPPEWSSEDGYLEITGHGWRRLSSGSGAGCPPRLYLSKYRRFPSKSHRPSIWAITDDHPLILQADAVIAEYDSLQAAKTALRNDLTTLLHSATTLEGLKAAWPAGAKFFPVETSKPMAVVPYELADKVSKLMGLEPVAAS